jgi:hypothetical protein
MHLLLPVISNLQEKLYAIVGAVLFLIATVLIFWYIFEYDDWHTWIVVTAVC